MDARNTGVLGAFIALCLLAGCVGAIFTIGGIPGWYSTLRLPALAPPGWVFGPVWTVLYIIMGISAYMVYIRRKTISAMPIFLVQLALNALWSIVFFGMHSPLGALFVMAALWVAIVLTVWDFWKDSRTAGMLLLPYMGWVAFAAALNFAIWRLN